MFRSLLHQLCKAERSVRTKVSSTYIDMLDTYGNRNVSWHAADLRKIFTECFLEVASSKSAIMLIDALDEADVDAKNPLASYFNDLNFQLVAAKASAKVCISSRHHPALSVKGSLTICVEEHNRDDIQLFFNESLTTVEQNSKRDDISSADYERLSNIIGDKAKGIFQWGEFAQLLLFAFK
jgi:hypothetical protein